MGAMVRVWPARWMPHTPPKQPAADSTVGVMVQRFTGVSIGVNARPRFPDGSSALFDLIEPAGGGILQQQLVSGVGVSVLRKHFAQERRGQKAGVQMTAVVQHHLVQRIRSGLALSFIQQTECNGTDIFTLPVGCDFSMICKGGMIGKAGFFRCVTVLRCRPLPCPAPVQFLPKAARNKPDTPYPRSCAGSSSPAWG